MKVRCSRWVFFRSFEPEFRATELLTRNARQIFTHGENIHFAANARSPVHQIYNEIFIFLKIVPYGLGTPFSKPWPLKKVSKIACDAKYFKNDFSDVSRINQYHIWPFLVKQQFQYHRRRNWWIWRYCFSMYWRNWKWHWRMYRKTLQLVEWKWRWRKSATIEMERLLRGMLETLNSVQFGQIHDNTVSKHRFIILHSINSFNSLIKLKQNLET